MRFVLTLVAALFLSVPALASCPGVDHVNDVSGSWETDSFFVAGTSTPLTVQLDISEVSNTATVEYHDGSGWVQVTVDSVVQGQAVRFTGPAPSITYIYGECAEDIQPDAGT